MDKFTNKLNRIESRKYTDKTKNDIYSFIKENLTVKIDGDRGYIDGDTDISLEGLEDLTEVLYNYVQQEKARQEVITLEKVKITLATGGLNYKNVNEFIENVNEKLKSFKTFEDAESWEYKEEPEPKCPMCKSPNTKYVNCYAGGYNAFKCRNCGHSFQVREDIKRLA